MYNLRKDTKVVCVASTVHTGNSRYKVKRRMKDQNERCVDVLVAIPNAIYDCNFFMGGVDLSDQLLQYYQTRRQTHKYWKTLFYHCVDISVTNAYILYEMALPESEKSKHDHKKFVASLINKLADAGSAVANLSPGSRKQPRSV